MYNDDDVYCRYAYDWKKIRDNLLPTKTVDQLFVRKKNCVGQGKTGIIKVRLKCQDQHVACMSKGKGS